MAKSDKAQTAEPGTALAAPGAESKSLATKIDLSILEEDSRASAADLGIRAQDVALPFLKVAQKMSKQLSQRDPLYIEGLQEGDFFNSVTNEVYRGDTGVLFIPCAFRPSYTEWKPRDSGGGLVKDHGTNAAIEAQATRNEKNKLVLPNGNHLVPSLQFFGLVVKDGGLFDQVLFNMAGSMIKKGKKLNALILNLVIPANQSRTGKEVRSPKPWYMSYKVTTVPDKNSQGEWMNLDIQYGPQTLDLSNGDELFLSARNFALMVQQDKVKVKVDDYSEDIAEAVATEESQKAF